VQFKDAKLIQDLRVYEWRGVSPEHGRKRLRELEEGGVIAPERTPTGRHRLSVEDAQVLAENL
jgi:hypothetical protein